MAAFGYSVHYRQAVFVFLSLSFGRAESSDSSIVLARPGSNESPKCQEDEYIDTIVGDCQLCSDLCQTHASLDPCVLKCPEYYRKHVLKTNHQSTYNVAAVDSDRLVKKPLFWTSIISMTIALFATILIIVMCLKKNRTCHRYFPLNRQQNMINRLTSLSENGKLFDDSKDSAKNSLEFSAGPNSMLESTSHDQSSKKGNSSDRMLPGGLPSTGYQCSEAWSKNTASNSFERPALSKPLALESGLIQILNSDPPESAICLKDDDALMQLQPVNFQQPQGTNLSVDSICLASDAVYPRQTSVCMETCGASDEMQIPDFHQLSRTNVPDTSLVQTPPDSHTSPTNQINGKTSNQHTEFALHGSQRNTNIKNTCGTDPGSTSNVLFMHNQEFTIEMLDELIRSGLVNDHRMLTNNLLPAYEKPH